MTISQSNACRRLSACGIGQHNVHNILNLIQKWKRSEGVEHTVKRLKAMKVAYLQKLAGKPVSLEWVAHTSTSVKGPFRCLFRHLEGNKVQKSLSALMVYSAESAVNVTPKQALKFFSSMEEVPSQQENVEVRSYVDLVKWLSHEGPPFPSLPRLRKVPTDRFYAKRGPTLMGTGTVEHNPWMLAFSLTDPGMQQLAKEVLLDPPSSFFAQSVPDDLIVGRLGFAQEPGYKLRVYANPVPAYNWLTSPLKDELLSILGEVPEDCTHDQMAGVTWAQKKLNEGKPIASVDLSDATNLFPLDLQMEVLRICARNAQESWSTMVSQFERLARGKWYDPYSGTYRRWSKGQPLGLAPSFPLFALSHHVIARLAIASVSKDPRDLDLSVDTQKYRILGDDIVILQKYEHNYKQIMERIGCKISHDKTISSDRLAEFASRVITPDMVYVQNKWREMSDNSFLQLAKNLGPQSVGLLRARQRRIVDILSEVPEEYGGLGWNPKGKSFQERVENNWDAITAYQTEDRKVPHRKVKPNAIVDPLRQPIFREDGTPFRVSREFEGFESKGDQPLDKKGSNLHQDLVRTLRVNRESLNDGEKISDFKPEERPTGDPRGPSSLDTLERKLTGVSGKPKRKTNWDRGV